MTCQAIPTVLSLLLAGLLAAAEPDPVSYVVDLTDPRNHMIAIEMVAPTGGADALELFLPVWTPGSYLVREYSRNVQELSATDPEGAPLAVTKTRKNRWQVAAADVSQVRVRYRVYCREMSVRTNWMDAELGILVGAATFLTPVGAGAAPHDVQLVLPEDWKESVTALPAHPDGAAHHYRAADYDTLVDSPIVAGNPALYPFEAGGVPHVLADFGEGGIWDGARASADTKRIVETQQAFWGVVPYDRYVFLNLITESGGGLEHKNSTMLMTSRWKTRTEGDYQGWLGLVSHEFFHTWNVKRLRPRALGPFDYENEVYTQDLWIVEGITSYYDDLLLLRAGLVTPPAYLAQLSSNIQQVESNPGRLVHALGMTSFDAWIKYYRSDESFKNSSVSYYAKGAVVGWLLDVEIRRATDGAASLDDVMRLAYERFSGAAGYTSQEFRDVANEVAGTDLSAFFARAVDSTQELDYQPALDYLGLSLRKPVDPKGNAGAAWLGFDLETKDGRIEVKGVIEGTPAFAAGFNVGDELLALDLYRVRDWNDRAQRYRPGQEAKVLVARRDRLLLLPVTFGAEPQGSWGLELAPGKADKLAQQHCGAWLSGKRRQ